VTVLRIVGVSTATYYHRKQQSEDETPRIFKGGRPQPGHSITVDNKPVCDEQIKEYLLELVSGEEHAYGYRKLTVCLRRDHQLIINKKKVYRLCEELNLLRPQRQVKVRYPRRLANNREVTASNQLWEMDVKYGYIEGEQRFFFLLSVLDVYDRSVVDYHFGLTCEAKFAVEALQRALWKRNLFESVDRPTIRTDNGPQFISHVFEASCEKFGVEHERIPPKTPNKNAHIESFHAVLEDECLRRSEFESYADAYTQVSNYIRFYNERRIHGSLHDLSPAAFREATKNGQVLPVAVKV